MGAAFDRWLARPSTLRFLRHLIAPHTRPARQVEIPKRFISNDGRKSSGFAVARGDGAGQEKDGGQQDEEGRRDKQPIVRLKDIQSSARTLQPDEMAIKMSLMAGVSILAGSDQRNTFATLKHQSNVGNAQLFGELLVDDPAQRDNFSLWIEIIKFRHRVDGFGGVYDVWKGMRKRNVDLPVEGPEADHLWELFIQSGICRPNLETDTRIRLRADVLEYARDLRARTQRSYAGLYINLVGRWLQVQPCQAYQMHLQLKTDGFAPPGSVAGVAPFALGSAPAFKAFTSIYRACEERNLYDFCIDKVLGLRDPRVALSWHQLFLSSGDGPSSAMFARDDVQQLFDFDKGTSLPMRMSTKQRLSKQVVQSPGTKQNLPPMSRVGMNALVGDVHGIKPKTISDSFCAKLLATTAFSLNVVVSGLSFFGVQTLGPLAIRELVLRVGSPFQFRNMLVDLKARGIELDDSLFSRLATTVSTSASSVGLWTALLESDQHPDAFGDFELQEQLLSTFLEEKQWAKAHLALITLSVAGAREQHRGWNRILQHYIAHRQFRSMLDTMQSIRDQKAILTTTTMEYMYRLVLPRRKPGHGYVKGSSTNLFDSLRFCTNAFIYAAQQNCYVRPSIWTEILKRLGMDGRWDELRRIVLWMSHWYADNRVAVQRTEEPRSHVSPSRRPPLRSDLIQRIFSANMIHAIFTWGFRHASRHRRLYKDARLEGVSEYRSGYEPWASGLVLLKLLQERGVPVQPVDVRNAIILRMWILFGPAWSKRAVNNEARMSNKLSLAHYLRHCNSLWPGLFEYINVSLLDESSESNAELLVQLFGRTRATRFNNDEYANVEAWAEALGRYENHHIYEPSGIPAKHAAWEKSPFRLKLVRPSSDRKGASAISREKESSATSQQDNREDNETSKPGLPYTPF